MSIQLLDEAVSFLKSSGQKIYEMGPVTQDEIVEFSARFDFPLPASYVEFLKRYGALSVRSLELYGLIPGDIQAAEVPNALWITDDLSEKDGLPKNMLVVESLGDGVYACLALSVCEDGEAPVLAWDAGLPNQPIAKMEKLSASFGEYVQKRVGDTVV